jgi:hypothetical protein
MISLNRHGWWMLLLLLPELLCAEDFKIWSQPLGLTNEEKIDLASVQVVSLPPDEDWLSSIRRENPRVADRLTLHAVASIEVTFWDMEEAVDSTRSLNALVEAGKKRAAEVGANILYMNRCLSENGQTAGVHLLAYRMNYDGRVVPPYMLAALPQTTYSEEEFQMEVQDWSDRHFGHTRVAFKNEAKSAAHEVIGFLGHVKNGTPVRLVLKNSPDYDGSYEGIDEDNQIWIKPEGWIGLLTERSFPAKSIEGVQLFN